MDVLTLSALTNALPDNAMIVRSLTVAAASLATLTWRTELSVTGSGYLHALFGSHGTGRQLFVFRVTVDGGTPRLLDTGYQTMVGVNGTATVGGYILGTRFKTALVVEIQNAHTASQALASNTIYSLDA